MSIGNSLKAFGGGILMAILVFSATLPTEALDVAQQPSKPMLANGYLLGSRSDSAPPRTEGATDEVSASGFSTSPIVIPAAAFSSEDESDQFFFNLMFGYTEGDPYACLKAPVYLPHGATITSFYAYLYDNNDPSNITVMLRRAGSLTGAQADMGQISTTGTGTSIQYLGDTTISPADVSNLYSYWLSTCVNSNTRIHAVRIFYQYSVYLPMIIKAS